MTIDFLSLLSLPLHDSWPLQVASLDSVLLPSVAKLFALRFGQFNNAIPALSPQGVQLGSRNNPRHSEIASLDIFTQISIIK